MAASRSTSLPAWRELRDSEQATPLELPPAKLSLLDRMLEAGTRTDTASEYVPPDFVDEFLASEDDWTAAGLLLGRAALERMTLAEYRGELSGLMARAESLLAEQIDRILHHPAFQKLEASWRGLRYLVMQTDRSLREDNTPRTTRVKIQVLDVSQDELQKSFSRAVEFDQSELFRKVYQQGFGQAGGEPYGMLLGDYEFQSLPRDCELLRQIAGVAAMSFAPFVAAAHPNLLGLDRFSELQRPFDLATTFSGAEMVKWQSFRRSPDAKFSSLIAPRLAYRAPYADDGKSLFGFRFAEDVSGRISLDGTEAQTEKYLWGNPCYAFGAVVVRSFCRTGWFAEIRGQRMGEVGGGMIDGLPQIHFETESAGLAIRPQTEIVLSRYWEDEMARNGLIPVADCQDSPYAMFPSNSSAYRGEKTSQDPVVQENERLSSMTQYVLCASRFAHYLKVITRNKLGSSESPESLENDLNGRWLQRYVSQAPQLDTHRRAEFPLREGRVKVDRIADRPGAYDLKIYLRPQFQLDDVEVGIQLDARDFSG